MKKWPAVKGLSCLRVCVMIKDFNNISYYLATYQEYLFYSVVGQFFKTNFDLTVVTMATCQVLNQFC